MSEWTTVSRKRNASRTSRTSNNSGTSGTSGRFSRDNSNSTSGAYRPVNNRTSDRYNDRRNDRMNDRRNDRRNRRPQRIVPDQPVVPKKPVAPVLSENNFPTIGNGSTEIRESTVSGQWNTAVVIPESEPEVNPIVQTNEIVQENDNDNEDYYHTTYEEPQINVIWDSEQEDYIIDEEPYYYPGRPMASIEEYYSLMDEWNQQQADMERHYNSFYSPLYRISCFRCNAKCRHPECTTTGITRCKAIDGLAEDKVHSICSTRYHPEDTRHHACYLCHDCYAQLRDDAKTNTDLDGNKIVLYSPCGEPIVFHN